VTHSVTAPGEVIPLPYPARPVPVLRLIWTDCLLRAALAICLLLAEPVAAATPETASGAHRVVLLNSADPDLPAFVALDRALRETVRKESKVQVEFFAETLDMQRFGTVNLEAELNALLGTKYQNLPVDVVVAVGSAALAFAQRHRQTIWPHASLVFYSVSDRSLIHHVADRETAGLRVNPDFGPTIELALRLKPATRTIAVVAGATETDRINLSNADRSLRQYAGGLDLEYLVGLTLQDTLGAVKALPADAIVLYVTVFRDGSGLPQVPARVLERIAAVSPVPVFGIHETYLGHGIVAGAISGYSSQGHRAGELVASILNGEDPSAIGIVPAVPARCMADQGQLDKWGIQEGLLPADCDIRFREITTWDEYRWQILTAISIFLAQALLIVMLVLNHRRLRRAQTELETQHALRTEIEKKASMLQRRLTRFSRERSLGAMATTITHEISQPLIAIQNYTQAALRRSQGDGSDRSKLIELLGKIEGQAERAGEITRRVRSLVSSQEVDMQPTPLTTLVAECITMVLSETDDSNCRIVYHPAEGLPRVLADSLQIQLVLINLLSNALASMARRRTRDGIIAIDAELRDDHLVQVSVTDTGTGIPPDRVQHIFDPLYSDKNTGMGIGLAIGQEIIALHGGHIWYEHNPAGGAIFRFTLRAAES
jgi:signal transduction histidine kinase